jgi:hypothetical protein
MNMPISSVVDQGPVGTETFSRIRIRKNHSGSGNKTTELWETEKFNNFLPKMPNLKTEIPFYQKNLTHLQDGTKYKGNP